MSERDTQKTKDVDVSTDVDIGLGESVDETVPRESADGASTSGKGTSQESSGGIVRSVYGRTLGRVLSTTGLGVSVAVTILFSLLFSLIPVLGLLGQLIGVGVAGFLYGLVGSENRYLELLVAGGTVGGGSALLGNLLVVTFGSMGLLGVGVLGGAIAAVVGHYFGRDMREGITRDVP